LQEVHEERLDKLEQATERHGKRLDALERARADDRRREHERQNQRDVASAQLGMLWRERDEMLERRRRRDWALALLRRWALHIMAVGWLIWHFKSGNWDQALDKATRLLGWGR
jgi:hypothetical protein